MARPSLSHRRKTILFAGVATALSAIFLFLAYQATHRYHAKTAAVYHKLIDRFRTPAAASPIPAFVAAPLEGPVTPVFALFDAIDLYQKNGLVELYGSDLRQRKSGAIGVSHSIMQVSDGRAYLFWSPDYSPVRGATHMEVRLHNTSSSGQIKVGVISSTGSTYLFESDLGTNMPPPNPKLLPPLVPDAFLSAISKPTHRSQFTRRSDGILSAAVPAELITEFNSPEKGDKAIATFFLVIDNAANTALAFDRIAFVKAATDPKQDTISLAGTVSGALITPGSTIRLLTDRGEQIEQQLSLDNTFRFEGIKVGQPISLRFKHNKLEYYSGLGRWFALEADHGNLRVNLEPLYSNPDGHPADATKAKFVGPRKPSEVGAYYELHARQVWPGGGKLQEYDSITFTNNMGFIDRDRFFDNPDRCVRIVHLGGSDNVALQVRPYEKTNIEMESELSVLLQRCVEVISAGRDNGDIGSNYPRIRDYAVKFKPDAILISNLNALMMQLQPELLKRAIGWNHESNALDNFYYDAKGSLTFRPWAKDYPLFTTPPDFAPLSEGVALFQTLQVPYDDMHSLGKDAFRYFGDILQYFIQHHPNQRFIVHTGIDEAQCFGRCNTQVKLKNGKTVPMGAATFVANHKEFCNKNGLDCIHPQGAESYNTEVTYLTFIHDGHYSVRGHQWLARELAVALVPTLRQK